MVSCSTKDTLYSFGNGFISCDWLPANNLTYRQKWGPDVGSSECHQRPLTNLTWDQTVQCAVEGDGWRAEVRRYMGESGTEGRELAGDRAVKQIHLPHWKCLSSVVHIPVLNPHTGAHPTPPTCCMSVLRVYAGVWVRSHIVGLFIYKLSLCLFLLPASLGPTRREIYPQSPPSNAYHRRPRNCSAILQVHLSEFVLFKSPPACFGFHLFTVRGSKYSYRWKLVSLRSRCFSCNTLFKGIYLFSCPTAEFS